MGKEKKGLIVPAQFDPSFALNACESKLNFSQPTSVDDVSADEKLHLSVKVARVQMQIKTK